MTPTTHERPRRKPERLDERVLRDGLAPSRAKAQALILAGRVFVNGARTDEWTMTMDRDHGRWVERFIALPRKMPPNDVVTVALRLARPRVPSLEPAVPDTRALGVALSAMMLTESGPPP